MWCWFPWELLPGAFANILFPFNYMYYNASKEKLKKLLKHDELKAKKREWNEQWNLIKINIRATRTQFGVRILHQIDKLMIIGRAKRKEKHWNKWIKLENNDGIMKRKLQRTAKYTIGWHVQLSCTHENKIPRTIN